MIGHRSSIARRPVSHGVFLSFLFVFAAGRAPGRWRRRASELTRNSPLYGRTILRGDLDALRSAVENAFTLSPSKREGIAYLIQGEENTTDKESAMWGPSCDVFVLTFRAQRHDAIFFPNSLLAEGRNVLLSAAAAEELRRGYGYLYYVFLDADVMSDQPWARATPLFQEFLEEWEPAVGLPRYGPSSEWITDPQTIFHFDHIFIAIHAEAAPALLPYNVTFDSKCAWVSQWSLTVTATALFRNHVVVCPSLRVLNLNHSDYPRNDCDTEFRFASKRLRARVAQGARSCFPDFPDGVIFTEFPGFSAKSLRKKEKGLPVGLAKLGFASYVPWGSPRRKGRRADAISYVGANLNHVKSCDNEPLSKLLNEPSFYPLSKLLDVPCKGCTVEQSFLWLQSVAAAGPYIAENWNALGVWITVLDYGAGDSTAIAAICFAIAQRLLLLSGKPSNVLVEENLDRMMDRLRAATHPLAVMNPVSMQSLWHEENRWVLSAFIESALLSDIDDMHPLLYGDDLEKFITVLLRGVFKAGRYVFHI